jgi:hypothetical protein
VGGAYEALLGLAHPRNPKFKVPGSKFKVHNFEHGTWNIELKQWHGWELNPQTITKF